MEKKTYRILFQGDSVTDCGRVDAHPPMGDGYPKFVSSYLGATYTAYDFEFINRGISGNRVRDLRARWQEDCIDLKPDIITIFIGINDTWRRYDSNDPTSAEAFEEDYRFLLDEIKQKLPETKVVLLSPVALPFPEDRKTWREDLDPKIAVVEKLAKEYETYYIPMDRILNERCEAKPSVFWAEDGVHPTPTGHIEVAKQVIAVLRNIIGF